jgi:hypothetical protein
MLYNLIILKFTFFLDKPSQTMLRSFKNFVNKFQFVYFVNSKNNISSVINLIYSGHQCGAMTLSIMTFSIMTFSIMTLSILMLSIIVNKMRHSA